MNKIILALILALALISPADAKVYTAKGSAMIIDGAKKKAQELAEKSAVRKAVADAMASMVPEDSQDRRKLNASKGKLLQKSASFVQSSNVRNETVNDNMLTVEMMVAIDEQKLKAHLSDNGIFATAAKEKKMSEFPSVTVILTEEIGGTLNTSPYSAEVIRQALMDAGFEVVDEKVMKKSIKHDQAVQALLNNDLKNAQAVTLQFGAGVLVTGKAVVQKSGVQSGGMQVQGANISLRAVKADNGKVISTASAEGHYPHINALTGSRKAVEEAAAKAAGELVKKMMVDLEKASDNVLVSISGLNYKQLALIKKILQRDFKQISKIKQQSFNGSVAKLDLTLQSSVTEFMDKIALHDFGTFTLSILNYSPGKVDMALKMVPQPAQ